MREYRRGGTAPVIPNFGTRYTCVALSSHRFILGEGPELPFNIRLCWP